MKPQTPAPDPLRRGNIALLAVLEGLPDATVGATRDGRIVFCNGLAEQQFGYDRKELIGEPIEILWPERLRERYKRNLELYFELDHPLRFTERAYGRCKDGSEFIGEMSWGIVASDDGPLLLAIGRNISERLQTEQRLRRQSEQQAVVAALGERALRGLAPGELSKEAAERVRAVLGVERVEVLDGPREIAAWGALERAASKVSVPIHTGDRVHGALVAASSTEGAFGEEEGSFLQAVANVLAIGFSRLHLEEQMRQQALHDSLTGLANRTLCRDRILHALAMSEREGGNAAVLYVDVDNFKRVNDVFGHAAGDELLIALAQRMVATVRPADTVARLGGDEFVVVCESVDERTALALGWRVAAAVQEPIVAAGTEHQLAASIGIALGTGAGTDPDVLIGHADTAAYRAKERGSGRVELFDEGLRRRAAERLRTESDLEGALERRELELVFQPIVSLATGETVAARSAAALAARGAGDRAGGLHPGGRGVGADHPDRLMGARARLPHRGGAGRRHRRLDLGQPLRAPGRPARPARGGRGRAALRRAQALRAAPRADRDRAARRDAGDRVQPRSACTTSACGSCSTTSAPATRRSSTSRTSRSTRSRSTARSSPTSAARRRTRRSWRRWCRWRARSGSASWPRAWRTRRRRSCCASSAARSRRATSSARRPRGHASSTPARSSSPWSSCGAACTARGVVARAMQCATRCPAASPTFHSTGCSRYAPLVMCVVPIALPAPTRFSTRCGTSAPSGISNGWQARSR